MLEETQVNNILLSYLSKNMSKEEIAKGLESMKTENNIDLRQIMVMAQNQLSNNIQVSKVEVVNKQPKMLFQVLLILGNFPRKLRELSQLNIHMKKIPKL